MQNPAEKVIGICGGAVEVARITGRTHISVRRWTYPKDRGGTGGLIPSEAQQRLLDHAREKQIALLPEHFFHPAPEPAEPAPEPRSDAA